MPKESNPIEDHYDLNHLSRESWQLELLVSGIILLLLFSSDEWSTSVSASAQAWIDGGISQFLGVLLFGIPMSIGMSKIFFIVHVLIRGLWIGALGLRSVSGNIELDSLHLNKWFSKFLSRYQGSFDQYILRLERLASVIFSFNFLLIFYMFSILLTIGWISLFGILGGIVHKVFYFPAVFISLGLFLNFIDFISVQRLKRGKFAYLYFPFYYITNTLNLSFLYRSLHYNFVDSPYTRRILKGLIIVGIGVFVINGITFNLSPWLTRISPSSVHVYQTIDYGGDLEKQHINRAYISNFENHELLKVTTPFNKATRFQNYLYHICPHLEDINSFSWYTINTSSSGFNISTAYERAEKDEIVELLNCYKQSKAFAIDGEKLNTDNVLFLFNDDFSAPRGLQFFISLDSVQIGLHNLEIKTFYMNGDSIRHQTQNIAFYKLKSAE